MPHGESGCLPGPESQRRGPGLVSRVESLKEVFLGDPWSHWVPHVSPAGVGSAGLNQEPLLPQRSHFPEAGEGALNALPESPQRPRPPWAAKKQPLRKGRERTPASLRLGCAVRHVGRACFVFRSPTVEELPRDSTGGSGELYATRNMPDRQTLYDLPYM